MDEIERVIQEQGGLIARRQALGLGATPTQINRALRRREWVAVHPGVYVNHTGPLTWLERAWAGVLAAWPSALSHDSALRAGEGPGRRDRDDSTIHVAVADGRSIAEPPGVRLHRTHGFTDRVQWNLGPPRIRYEEAVLDVAAEQPNQLAAIATLADACGARRTHARRLITRLEARAWIPRRPWLHGILTDVAEGTCSVLEHAYLDGVERAHGLPPGRRQASARGSTYLDVLYEELALVVELDGRLFHASATARDRDMERDLDAATEGRRTLRLSYGQVLERPCSTSRKIVAVMNLRGWAGTPSPCASCERGDPG